MADYIPTIVIDTVIEKLAAFIAPFIPGGEVVRAQVNRVAMPANPCAILTELLGVDLCIPYLDPTITAETATIKGPTRIDVQIDFYGPLAGNYCKAVQAAFRSQWAYGQFPANIRPLYTSDGVQSPLLTGEQQYESRWTLTASMQYNPTVTVPQQSANALATNIVDAVDVG
jgi:hypothetical protein